MVCVNVDVDLDEVLPEISTDALIKELALRQTCKRNRDGDFDTTDKWTPGGLASDLRTAFYARNADRFELLASVVERRPVVDYEAA